MRNAKPAALGQRRDLLVIVRAGKRAALETQDGIAERFHHGVKAVPLHLPLPAGNNRFFLRALAQQRRPRLDRLEIHADADGVVDAGAVVELERRHRCVGIDGAECRSELLVVAQVDLNGRHGDPFLRQKDADASRTGGSGAIKEFHGISSVAESWITSTASGGRGASRVQAAQNEKNFARCSAPRAWRRNGCCATRAGSDATSQSRPSRSWREAHRSRRRKVRRRAKNRAWNAPGSPMTAP